MQPYQKEFIELALAHNALAFGEFTLKSGRISPYFFNAGKLATGQALNYLGKTYAQKIKEANINFDCLFGTAYKGIPLVAATAASLYKQYNENYSYAFNRKEAKDHGEGGMLVGELKHTAVIVDDVITAGTATAEAISILKAYKVKPAALIIALNRQEKGSDNMSAIKQIEQAYRIPVLSIITRDNLLEYVEQENTFNQYIEKMHAYKETYGI